MSSAAERRLFAAAQAIIWARPTPFLSAWEFDHTDHKGKFIDGEVLYEELRRAVVACKKERRAQ